MSAVSQMNLSQAGKELFKNVTAYVTPAFVDFINRSPELLAQLDRMGAASSTWGPIQVFEGKPNDPTGRIYLFRHMALTA